MRTRLLSLIREVRPMAWRILTASITALTLLTAVQGRSQPADLTLQNTIVDNTSVFTATNSILAGPDFTITGNGDVILDSPSIRVKGRIYVLRGGRLKVVTQTVAVSVRTRTPDVPGDFFVGQNYPNPFNPSTQIDYALPVGTRVEIVVYNIFGQVIRSLTRGFQSPGSHTVTWDGTDDAGIQASSGVYFCRIVAGEDIATRKLLLMK